MLNKKKYLRKKMKLLRRKMYTVDESAAWEASKNFINYFKENFSTIGIYWPMPFELDTRPLIKILLNKNDVQIFLPTINKNAIEFSEWKIDDPLYYNKLKFYAPCNLHIKKPKVIIVPLLAFDERGE